MNLKEKLFKMGNNAWYIVTIQYIINTVLMYLLHFEVLDLFGAKLELQGSCPQFALRNVYWASPSSVPGSMLGTGVVEWQIDMERVCLFLNYYDNHKTETSLLPFFSTKGNTRLIL